MLRRAGLVLVWLVTVPAVARAERATFDLDVRGAAWQASSLRVALAADLAGPQLAPAAAGTRGDLHVAITVHERTLGYVLSRDGVAPVRGTIALGSVDRRALAGVLKDELHRLVPHRDAGRGAVEVPVPAPAPGAFAALALLAAIVALPLVLARRRTRAAPRIVAVLAGIALVALALAMFPDAIAEASPGLFAAGGLAWGLALASCLPIALPPLVGIHRVEHRELGPVLRAWLALALQRALWLAVGLAPIGVALWWIGDALGVPAIVTLGVIAPLVILIARLVWRSLVELVASRLDDELVDRPAADAWHAQVRGYLGGYLRRANLEVDGELLDRVRFLPGREPELVAVYGGGLAHTRVVIDRGVLERALAPYGRPHDYAMPRVSTLHWTYWNAGLVMPTASDEQLATRADRDPKSSAVGFEDAANERIALGEPPTFTGIVEPTAFDPRTSYRPGEDPLWLDWDPGEEYDGTDAGDKDFLFGVLVAALGTAQRHEDRARTFAIAWRRWVVPGRVLRGLARVTAPLRAVAARNAAALADLHAVLGGARHHLAQHLAWQLWRRDDLLTARAYVPQLEHRSRAILAALDADANEEGPLRERLRRLRRFLDPRAVVRRSQRQRVALAFAVLVACAVVAALAVQAVLYHATYEERRTDGKRS